jgi:hypothetical protein
MIFANCIFVSLIVGQSKASLRLKPLNNDWNDDSYKSEEYFDFNHTLSSSKFTLSGFSSGAILTTNLFAMFNQHIDGVAVLAGLGPCATRHYNIGELIPFMSSCQDQQDVYPTDGYAGSPVYFYTGKDDSIVP